VQIRIFFNRSVLLKLLRSGWIFQRQTFGNYWKGQDAFSANYVVSLSLGIVADYICNSDHVSHRCLN